MKDNKQISDSILQAYQEVVGAQYPDQTTLRDKINGMDLKDVPAILVIAYDLIRTGPAINVHETRFKDVLKGKLYAFLGGGEEA